ncbi:DUF5996 family protein [Methylobacterium fujisawaense]|uniref:DUF5996 family protein n=1 Tax=Methylobacterium fujisawaense TaxID=107400 RepID=UPI003CC7ACD4
MGGLVQSPQAARTDRPHPSRRGGSPLSCPGRDPSLGRMTQTKRPPGNPARFNLRHSANPDRALLAFLESTYSAGATAAGWDSGLLGDGRPE